jgi:HAD superfamily hydrolase (TIGR01549 family)
MTMTADRLRPLIGMGGDRVLPRVAGISEPLPLGQAIVKRKQEAFARLLPALQATRGARPLLLELRRQGLAIGIATSAGEEEARALLAKAGVADLVPEPTSKDDAQHSKPAPDIVLAAMAERGGLAATTVMVGDTPYDVEAALRAGVRAIALRCGGHWGDADFKGASAIYDDPEALLAHWGEGVAVTASGDRSR